MSSYMFKARRKGTDIEVMVHAMDDYFGSHRYGYVVSGNILNETAFWDAYEEVSAE